MFSIKKKKKRERGLAPPHLLIFEEKKKIAFLHLILQELVISWLGKNSWRGQRFCIDTVLIHSKCYNKIPQTR